MLLPAPIDRAKGRLSLRTPVCIPAGNSIFLLRNDSIGFLVYFFSGADRYDVDGVFPGRLIDNSELTYPKTPQTVQFVLWRRCAIRLRENGLERSFDFLPEIRVHALNEDPDVVWNSEFHLVATRFYCRVSPTIYKDKHDLSN